MTVETGRPGQAPRRAARRGGRIASKIVLYLALLFAILYTIYPLLATAFDAFGANIAALFVGNNLIEIGGAPFAQGIFTFNPDPTSWTR